MFDKVQTVIRSSSKPRSQKKGEREKKKEKEKGGRGLFSEKNTVSMENRIKNLVQQYRTFPEISN